MKRIASLSVLLLALSSVLLTAATPVTRQTIGIDFDRDASVRWRTVFTGGNERGVIYEMVPEGQTVENWRELLAIQINYTDQSVADHVAGWRGMVTQGAPDAEVAEETLPDGSVLVVYSSVSFNEYGIRRFFRGEDGVYALAYHIRLNARDEARIALWREIVKASFLKPNPFAAK